MRNLISINGVTYQMVNESRDLTEEELDDIYNEIVDCGKTYTVNRDGRKVKVTIEFDAYESAAPGSDGYTLEVGITDSEGNYDTYYSGDEDIDDLLKLAKKISKANSRNSVFDIVDKLDLYHRESGNRGTDKQTYRRNLQKRYGY